MDAPAKTHSFTGLQTLKKLSADEVSLRRRLFSSPHKLQRSGGSEKISFLICGAAPDNTEELVELCGHKQKIQLSVNSDPFCVPLGDQVWSDFQGESRLLAWSLAHETLIGYLEMLLEQPLLPKRIGGRDSKFTNNAKALWVGFIAQNETSPASCEGVLGLPHTWAKRLLVGSSAGSVELRPDQLGKLPMKLSVQLKCPALPTSDIRGVRIGDVIVLGQSGAVLGCCDLTINDVALFQATFEKGVLRLMSSHYRNLTDVTEDSEVNPNKDETPATQSVDDNVGIPVSLQFEVGTLTLTLDELSKLQPGYVFSLPAPATGTGVRIRANGATVGQGQLVVAGDNLGVSVTEWPDGGIQ